MSPKDCPTYVAAFTILALVGASCSSPPPSAPSPGQVAGAWVADSTLTAVVGGECIGVDMRSALGKRDVFLVAMTGDNSIDATITSQGNGTSCEYSGSNVSGRLNLSMSGCHTARVSNVACSNGARRDLVLTGGSIQAQASPALGTGSGVDQASWSVFAVGGSQPLDVLSTTASFTWVFLGLPASNYHTFTGTVFPGYADGTISIPADPNPWCLPCGWFVSQNPTN